MPVNRVQLFNELALELGNDEEIDLKTKAFAEEVKEYWKHIAPSAGDPGHPYATDAYKESIERIASRGQNAKGRFTWSHWVGTFDPIAHLLEYGTLPDAPGGHANWIGLDGERHWSGNTPTPAFAFAARVAIHFGGTPDSD